MRNEILSLIDNPTQLEKLYRENKSTFRKEFNQIYSDIKDNKIADFWNARLNFETNEIKWVAGSDLIFVIVASLLAGLVAKIPQFTSIGEEFFYSRNIGFIVFPFLTSYFAWKNKIPVNRIFVSSAITLASLIFINLLPANDESHTLFLSCIHLPLLLWAVLGYSFVGDNIWNHQRRIDFLKYNGELLVMMALIVIAGGILTGVTSGLFSLIGIDIQEFYVKNVIVVGLAAVPIVATYIV